jgi:hypothetical protein
MPQKLRFCAEMMIETPPNEIARRIPKGFY